MGHNKIFLVFAVNELVELRPSCGQLVTLTAMPVMVEKNKVTYLVNGHFLTSDISVGRLTRSDLDEQVDAEILETDMLACNKPHAALAELGSMR